MKSTTRIRYEDVTERTDLSVLNIANRIQLYEELLAAVNGNGSKEKKEHRILIKSMIETIKMLNKNINDREQQINRLKRDSQEIDNCRVNEEKYGSYADCVNNKSKENLVIIKKDGLSEMNLKNEVFRKLDKVKREIVIRKIRENKNNLIIDVSSEIDQQKIIEELRNETEFECRKPRKMIPSILIKEIEKIEIIGNREECEKYLKREISINHAIKEENINIKVIINKKQFKTMRCIVNLDEDNTRKILNNGYVKIGFMACPVEKTINIVQCKKCYRFGHHERSKDGKESTCRAMNHNCPICAEEHVAQECPNKEEKDKIKCINCKEKHTAFSNKCVKRREKLNELLAKCIC
jgi:hypothetical protein